MPGPTAHDAALGEIDDLAAGILVSLRVMHHCTAPTDVPRMRARLREQLENYVTAVMSAAPGGK